MDITHLLLHPNSEADILQPQPKHRNITTIKGSEESIHPEIYQGQQLNPGLSGHMATK